jgi:hypothetical protein
VLSPSGSVDLPRSSRQQSVQRHARQIKVSEVKQVVEAYTRLHAEPITNFVGPTEFQIEGPSQERFTSPGGASGTDGATAPNARNCVNVNNPFWMSTWPAGVGWFAYVLL